MPWSAFVHLPLVHAALPARFGLFVSLAAAMMAAIWIALPGQRHARLALGGLACLTLLPALHPWINAPAARFFKPGETEAVLGARPKLLVLPFAINGPSSYWQAENLFGFVQTGGYLGFPPKSMQAFPAVGELFGGVQTAGFQHDLTTFCDATHTQFIVIGPGTPPQLQASVAQMHWARRQVDDVIVYTVPGSQAGHG
jgi:hypothetical protein